MNQVGGSRRPAVHRDEPTLSIVHGGVKPAPGVLSQPWESLLLWKSNRPPPDRQEGFHDYILVPYVRLDRSQRLRARRHVASPCRGQPEPDGGQAEGGNVD